MKKKRRESIRFWSWRTVIPAGLLTLIVTAHWLACFCWGLVLDWYGPGCNSEFCNSSFLIVLMPFHYLFWVFILLGETAALMINHDLELLFLCLVPIVFFFFSTLFLFLLRLLFSWLKKRWQAALEPGNTF